MPALEVSEGTRAYAVKRDSEGLVVSLEAVDPLTIYPMKDSNGDIPRPPSPAFVQFIEGLPWWYGTAEDLLLAGPQGIKVMPPNVSG